MRQLLFIVLCLMSVPNISYAQQISGRLINSENREPLPYAKITTENEEILTNIDGSFSIQIEKKRIKVNISYIGFSSREIELTTATRFIVIQLNPVKENLDPVLISSKRNPADEIIKKAITRKDQNAPQKALQSFQFKSYNKFLIDNEQNQIKLQTDSTNLEASTIINTTAAYLSEKVSEFQYQQGKDLKEKVLGIRNAGFEKPVYELLSISANPFSLYKDDYQIFETHYAGPLAKSAFKNYSYKILDTTKTSRPAYLIYFKPKRRQAVAGLEGILYLDTKTYAIQKAKAQLLGAIKLETQHELEYIEEEKLWFPKKQTTTIRPGRGDQEIAVFGGVISTGRLQGSGDLISTVLSGGKPGEPQLLLNSVTENYDLRFNTEESIENPSAEIEVTETAFSQDEAFWKKNRQKPYTFLDKNIEKRVSKIVKEKEVEQQIEIKNSIATGFYPVKFWDFNLGKFFKFNNHEGIRLGFGGKTNGQISDKFNLNGFLVYGTKDEVFKYSLGTQIYLNKATGTNFNFNFTRDMAEVAEFKYLKGINEFSIIEPRFVNINFFYDYRKWSTSLSHRFTSKFDTELQLSHTDIWQRGNYSYRYRNQELSNYSISAATLSFLWRPFATFLHTGQKNIITNKGFPKFTGQIIKAFDGLNGDFNFTRAGLKVTHEIKYLNQSRTEIILEGNYAFGDLPLTHAFHAFPNNANRKAILRRFSVAGNTAFETMYYNEFFSDKQAMLHLKHQFRPWKINRFMKPEIVLISRHVIGDFENIEDHSNISFNTLDQGYSEAGLEINNILAGFGLGTAYRYGAYHLSTFDQNFAFKFTFQLQL